LQNTYATPYFDLHNIQNYLLQWLILEFPSPTQAFSKFRKSFPSTFFDILANTKSKGK